MSADGIRPDLLTAAEAFEAGDRERAEAALLDALGTVRKNGGSADE